MANKKRANIVPIGTVADYFLLRTMEGGIDCMTTVKMQKLLYYAQGFSFAMRQKPLFAETFQAWSKGPVCVSIYKRFKTRALYGVIDIGKMETDPAYDLPKKVIDFLDEIWDKFAYSSSNTLVRMTHQDAPWKEAYGDTPAGCRCKEEIKESRIREYFKGKTLQCY